MELEELFSGLDRYGLDPVTYQYFHQLLERRTVLLNYDVSDDIVERVYLPLKEFEDDNSNEPVTLILNSSGGSVSDGFFLAHYISQYSKPLNILVPGYACSMAAVILAGGGKNENVIRSCFPCSYALIHDGYVALAASESKTAADIMAFNDKVDEQIKDFIVKNTNITKEEYDSHMRHQWFLYADDMLEKGLIDRIIGVTEE
jgi:ATP-dependent Clp protease protease subunit